MSYVGKWSVEEPEVLKGIEGDKGLVMSECPLSDKQDATRKKRESAGVLT